MHLEGTPVEHPPDFGDSARPMACAAQCSVRCHSSSKEAGALTYRMNAVRNVFCTFFRILCPKVNEVCLGCYGSETFGGGKMQLQYLYRGLARFWHERTCDTSGVARIQG